MATFLTPDKILTVKVGNDTITIKQKITPDGVRATKFIASHIKKGDLVKPNAKLNNGLGKPKGITVHNTNDIKCANETNPAEQYARATYPNGNMSGSVVHYWVYKEEIWQQLDDSERGWHAADGSTRRASQRAGEMIGGNLDTISIECIESTSDSVSEATTAKLVAYLLDKHGLSPDTDIYTHSYFYEKKTCPKYILPHWNEFKADCKKYYEAIKAPTTKPQCNGKINGYNIARLADNLVIYNKGEYANTNPWGTEVAVNSNGTVTCAPVYGKGKMTIPKGGYVISGHGVASTWILENIKKGNKITIVNDTIKVSAATTLKFKVGDIVKFAGGIHYTSASGSKGSTVGASKAKITNISEKGKHPYHLRAVNDKGAFIDGVYGWVNISTISAIQTSSKTLEEIAREVINGNYGNGHSTREANLKKAGLLEKYTYTEIKAKVNELLK